jgi:predicted ArsR family transcriptional regulator
LAVALAVWFEAGLRKSNRVALSLSGLGAELGVRRDAARRGLAALEEAGLVGVERQAGRKPVVTILPYGE